MTLLLYLLISDFINRKGKGPRRCLKAVSLILTAAFIFSEVAWAAPEILQAASLAAQKPVTAFPQSKAWVEDVYRPRASRKTVYLIQDAHTNLSAQKNISSVLDHLLSKQKIRYVFLEAGTGSDSLSHLRDSASDARRRTVAEAYLHRGELSGWEYLDLTSEHPFVLWGVEDKELYWKALESYAFVLGHRKDFEGYVGRIEAAANVLRPRLLNPTLLSFVEQRSAFRKGEVPAVRYYGFLASEAARLGVPAELYPNILAVQKIRALESRIDFEKVRQEQSGVLSSLSEESLKDFEGVRDETRSPFRWSSHDSREAMGYFALLEEKMEDRNLYPELAKYLAYLKSVREILYGDLLDEQKRLESAVLEALIANSNERTLVAVSENVRSLRKLLEFTLTPGEFEAAEASPLFYDIAAETGFLNSRLLEAGGQEGAVLFLKEGFEELLSRARHFYTLARRRDEVFIGNMIRKMDEEGETRAVLITGGYHTPNLKTLLKKKGISFVCVTPQVLNETNAARYEKILFSRARESRQPLTRGPRVSAPGWAMPIPVAESGPPLQSLTRDLTGKTPPPETAAGARLAADGRISMNDVPYEAAFALGGTLEIYLSFDGQELRLRDAGGRIDKPFPVGQIPSLIQIGRETQNDVIVPQAKGTAHISRYHAHIRIDTDGTVYLDNLSSQGTKVGKKMLERDESVPLLKIPELAHGTSAYDADAQSGKNALQLFERANRQSREAEHFMMLSNYDKASDAVAAAIALQSQVRQTAEDAALRREADQNLKLLAARQHQIMRTIQWKDQKFYVVNWTGQRQGKFTGEVINAAEALEKGKATAGVVLFARDWNGKLYVQKSPPFFGTAFPGTRRPILGGWIREGEKNPVEVLMDRAQKILGIRVDPDRLERIKAANEDRPYDQRAYYRTYEFVAYTKEEWDQLRQFRQEVEAEEKTWAPYSDEALNAVSRVYFSVQEGYRRMFMSIIDPESSERLDTYASLLEQGDDGQSGIPASGLRTHRVTHAVFTYQLTPEDVEAMYLKQKGEALAKVSDTEAEMKSLGFEPIEEEGLYDDFIANIGNYTAHAFAATLLSADLRGQLKGRAEQSSEMLSAAEKKLTGTRNKIETWYERRSTTREDRETLEKAVVPSILKRADSLRETPDGDLEKSQREMRKFFGDSSDAVYDLARIYSDLRQETRLVETADDLYRIYSFFLNHFQSPEFDYNSREIQKSLESIARDEAKTRAWARALSDSLGPDGLKRLDFMREHLARKDFDPAQFGSLLRVIGQTPQEYASHLKFILEYVREIALPASETAERDFLTGESDRILNHVFEKYIRLPARKLEAISDDIAAGTIQRIGGGGFTEAYKIRHNGIEVAFLRPRFTSGQEHAEKRTRLSDMMRRVEEKEDLNALAQILLEVAYFLIEIENLRRVNPSGQRSDMLVLLQAVEGDRFRDMESAIAKLADALIRGRGDDIREYFAAFKEKLNTIHLFRIEQQFPFNSRTLKRVLESKSGGQMSLERKFVIARNIARGYAHLARTGLVHRDVKPENIVVQEESGEIRIGDLGLSLSGPEDPSKDTVLARVIRSLEKHFGKAPMTPGYFPTEAYEHYDFSMATNPQRDLIAYWYTILPLFGLNPFKDKPLQLQLAGGKQKPVRDPKSQAVMLQEMQESGLPAPVKQLFWDPRIGIKMGFGDFKKEQARTPADAAAVWDAIADAFDRLLTSYEGKGRTGPVFFVPGESESQRQLTLLSWPSLPQITRPEPPPGEAAPGTDPLSPGPLSGARLSDALSGEQRKALRRTVVVLNEYYVDREEDTAREVIYASEAVDTELAKHLVSLMDFLNDKQRGQTQANQINVYLRQANQVLSEFEGRPALGYEMREGGPFFLKESGARLSTALTDEEVSRVVPIYGKLEQFNNVKIGYTAKSEGLSPIENEEQVLFPFREVTSHALGSIVVSRMSMSVDEMTLETIEHDLADLQNVRRIFDAFLNLPPNAFTKTTLAADGGFLSARIAAGLVESSRKSQFDEKHLEEIGVLSDQLDAIRGELEAVVSKARSRVDRSGARLARGAAEAVELANRWVRRAEGHYKGLRLNESLTDLESASRYYLSVINNPESESAWAAEAHENMKIVEARRRQIRKAMARLDEEMMTYHWLGEHQGEPTGTKTRYLQALKEGYVTSSVLLFGRDSKGQIYLQKRGGHFGLSFPSTLGPTAAGSVRHEDPNPLAAIQRVAREELGIDLDLKRLRRIRSANEERPYDQSAFYKMYEYVALSAAEWSQLLVYKEEVENDEMDLQSEPVKRVIFGLHPGYRRFFMYIVDPKAQGRLEECRDSIKSELHIEPSDVRTHRVVRAAWSYLFTPEEILRIQELKSNRPPDLESALLGEEAKDLQIVDAAGLFQKFRQDPQAYSTDAFIPSLTQPDLRNQFLGQIPHEKEESRTDLERERIANRHRIDDWYKAREISDLTAREKAKKSLWPLIRLLGAVRYSAVRRKEIDPKWLETHFEELQPLLPSGVDHGEFRTALTSLPKSLDKDEVSGLPIAQKLYEAFRQTGGAELELRHDDLEARYALAGLLSDEERYRQIIETAEEVYAAYSFFLMLFRSQEMNVRSQKIQEWFSEAVDDPEMVRRLSLGLASALHKQEGLQLRSAVLKLESGLPGPGFQALLTAIGQHPQEFVLHIKALLNYFEEAVEGEEGFSSFLALEERAIASYIYEKHIRLTPERLEDVAESIANQTLRAFSGGGMNLAYRIPANGLELVLIRPQLLDSQLAKLENEKKLKALGEFILQLTFFVAEIEILRDLNPFGDSETMPYLLQAVGPKDVETIKRIIGEIGQAVVNRKEKEAWELFDRYKQTLRETRFFRIEQQFPYESVTLDEAVYNRMRRVQTEGPSADWTLGDKLRIAADIAGAVAEVTRRGIVHRDVKAPNILLLKDNRIKLVDYGISLPAEHGDRTKVSLRKVMRAIEKHFRLKVASPSFFPIESFNHYEAWMIDDLRRDFGGYWRSILPLFGIHANKKDREDVPTAPNQTMSVRVARPTEEILQAIRDHKTLPSEVKAILLDEKDGVKLRFEDYEKPFADLEAAAESWERIRDRFAESAKKHPSSGLRIETVSEERSGGDDLLYTWPPFTHAFKRPKGARLSENVLRMDDERDVGLLEFKRRLLENRSRYLTNHYWNKTESLIRYIGILAADASKKQHWIRSAVEVLGEFVRLDRRRFATPENLHFILGHLDEDDARLRHIVLDVIQSVWTYDDFGGKNPFTEKNLELVSRNLLTRNTLEKLSDKSQTIRVFTRVAPASVRTSAFNILTDALRSEVLSSDQRDLLVREFGPDWDSYLSREREELGQKIVLRDLDKQGRRLFMSLSDFGQALREAKSGARLASFDPYEMARSQIRDAAHIINLDPSVLELILKTERELEVTFKVRMDDGSEQEFYGTRIIHNNARGIGKGGIRYARGGEGRQDEALNLTRALATWMSLKPAVIGIPYGGAKGEVVSAKGREYSSSEVSRITRAYVRAMFAADEHAFGPQIDVPAPDFGTSRPDVPVMAVFLDELLRHYTEIGHLHLDAQPAADPAQTPYLDLVLRLLYEDGEMSSEELAAITGKPVDKGGSLGREKATGFGIYLTAQAALANLPEETLQWMGLSRSLHGSTVSIQGFGNVGSNAARAFWRGGAKVTAISDRWGTLENPNGIPVDQLDRHLKNKGDIWDFASGGTVYNPDLKRIFEVESDIFVPAAMEGQITEENAERVASAKKIIVEGANGPTTREAERILESKGLVIVPDILANSGGVIVSYFEWLQNLKRERWPEIDVDQMLAERLASATREVFATGLRYGISLRKAANVLALIKIADAELARNEGLRSAFSEVAPPYRGYVELKTPETIEQLRLLVERGHFRDFVAMSDRRLALDIEEAVVEILELKTSGKRDVRYVLLSGPPTVGKSFVAKAIARALSKRGYRTLSYDDDVDSQRLAYQQIDFDKTDFVVAEGNYIFSEMNRERIPAEKRYGLFINSVPSLKLSRNMPFTTSDLRLMAEILYRSYMTDSGLQAIDIIRAWPSERRRHIEEIYPTRKYADRWINTYLGYELPVIRDAILPELDYAEKIASHDTDVKRKAESLRIIGELFDVLRDIPSVQPREVLTADSLPTQYLHKADGTDIFSEDEGTEPQGARLADAAADADPRVRVFGPLAFSDAAKRLAPAVKEMARYPYVDRQNLKEVIIALKYDPRPDGDILGAAVAPRRFDPEDEGPKENSHDRLRRLAGLKGRYRKISFFLDPKTNNPSVIWTTSWPFNYSRPRFLRTLKLIRSLLNEIYPESAVNQTQIIVSSALISPDEKKKYLHAAGDQKFYLLNEIADLPDAQGARLAAQKKDSLRYSWRAARPKEITGKITGRTARLKQATLYKKLRPLEDNNFLPPHIRAEVQKYVGIYDARRYWNKEQERKVRLIVQGYASGARLAETVSLQDADRFAQDLKSESPIARQYAAIWLGYLGQKYADSEEIDALIPALEEALEREESENVRYYLVHALAQIGRPAEAVLAEAARGGDVWARYYIDPVRGRELTNGARMSEEEKTQLEAFAVKLYFSQPGEAGNPFALNFGELNRILSVDPVYENHNVSALSLNVLSAAGKIPILKIAEPRMKLVEIQALEGGRRRVTVEDILSAMKVSEIHAQMALPGPAGEAGVVYGIRTPLHLLKDIHDPEAFRAKLNNLAYQAVRHHDFSRGKNIDVTYFWAGREGLLKWQKDILDRLEEGLPAFIKIGSPPDGFEHAVVELVHSSVMKKKAVNDGRRLFVSIGAVDDAGQDVLSWHRAFVLANWLASRYAVDPERHRIDFDQVRPSDTDLQPVLNFYNSHLQQKGRKLNAETFLRIVTGDAAVEEYQAYALDLPLLRKMPLSLIVQGARLALKAIGASA